MIYQIQGARTAVMPGVMLIVVHLASYGWSSDTLKMNSEFNLSALSVVAAMY